jgi:hypothetical protein
LADRDHPDLHRLAIVVDLLCFGKNPIEEVKVAIVVNLSEPSSGFRGFRGKYHRSASRPSQTNARLGVSNHLGHRLGA